MPVGDSVDFLDFSAFVTNGIGQTAEDNMLEALLSSLPEPPAFTGPKDLLKPLNGNTIPCSAFGQSVALATPAASRRNTDEVDLPVHRPRPQPSIESLASTSVSSVGTLELAEEMPPVSPFFARVSFADIDSARDTVRRASLSRSRSLADSYERHAASWCAPSTNPGRMSLAEVTRALSVVAAEELLINQQPPPLLVGAERRWFRVNVYGLLTSQTARVTVTDASSPNTPVDASDAGLRHALRRYPLVLALCRRQQHQKQSATSRLKAPAPRQPRAPVLATPTLSFTVSARGASDRPVRSVDVEAMAAAYLRLGRRLSADVEAAADDSQCLRTPSQSSTATLADSLGPEAGADAAKPAPRSLLRQPQRRSDSGAAALADSGLPTPRQLRASASVANLRGAFAERRSTTASIPQGASRRRSEVQALLTQANAVMGGALEPQPRQLRPPRASFPLCSAPSFSLLRLPDAAPTGLRPPTALSPALAAALGRQQHRLEPARGHALRHSISSGDLAPPPRALRGSTPLSGIRPPPARSSQPALSRRVPPGGGLMPRAPLSAGASRLRHSGPSTATLRQSFSEGRSSEEIRAPPRRLTSGSIVRAGGVQTLFGAAGDEGFLTLRPVHTPDLVPRTIDPRLIERAMTPMLKTNVGIQYSSLVDLVRSAAGNGEESEPLPTLTEESPACEMPPSKLSPISSPEPSPLVAGAKPAKPGFLARYRSSKSSAPLPVSAIPLPPPVAHKPASGLQSLGLSNIPTLRKARSLWAMRSSQK
ncbi:hypothetical protein IWW39_003403 [Coemansia spiralis]|uniref:Uncharacterized protein n=1 Tax=Coemansia spiralis TaxID=417178 RepID=A0A9W8L4D8_9FUNG|nr:hypothetical protein IWW39_003403 [Coemansia spiralis]